MKHLPVPVSHSHSFYNVADSVFTHHCSFSNSLSNSLFICKTLSKETSRKFLIFHRNSPLLVLVPDSHSIIFASPGPQGKIFHHLFSFSLFSLGFYLGFQDVGI